MMHKDGGPVIGIQIENEYGHVGGYGGETGEQHIRTLTALAKKLGFLTPYYTATGWGGAIIGDLLPVMAGYCEAPWDQRLTELEANENYVFESYPYLTAELGGGLFQHWQPHCVNWNKIQVHTMFFMEIENQSFCGKQIRRR